MYQIGRPGVKENPDYDMSFQLEEADAGIAKYAQ